MEYPSNENNYEALETEGIKVYVNKDIKAKNNLLTIQLSGFFIFKTLEVVGADINY